MCERLDTIILPTFIKNEQVHLLMMGLTMIAYAREKKKKKKSKHQQRNQSFWEFLYLPQTLAGKKMNDPKTSKKFKLNPKRKKNTATT
jgi:hypothetical protein